MHNNFQFKTRHVSIVQRSSSVVNSFASSVELIQAMTYKLKRDTIQNFEKLTYNFKMHKTWNNTCVSTTLNTRKKIVKNWNNYNGYNTKCYENKNIYIHIYKINLKNNIRTRELSQHVSAAYLKWDSPIWCALPPST